MISRALLALDIDGTLTDHTHRIPKNVIGRLKELKTSGFEVLFNTGRALSYCLGCLEDIDFPYFLSVQNGADIFQMPDKTLINRRYFVKNVAEHLEGLYGFGNENFLLYSGADFGDFCYYRPSHFSADFLKYFNALKKHSDVWKEVTSFAEVTQNHFPLIKGFGPKEKLQEFQKNLKTNGLHTSLIKDPIASGRYMLLVTERQATKGHSINHIKSRLGWEGPVIAAGDDENDISMFDQADIKIVMETADESLKKMGDIIAPSSSKSGIIAALDQVILKWKI